MTGNDSMSDAPIDGYRAAIRLGMYVGENLFINLSLKLQFIIGFYHFKIIYIRNLFSIEFSLKAISLSS
jgi:hypothetical protein